MTKRDAPTVTIEAQVAEIERTLRERGHVQPRLIERGRLKPETADEQNRNLRAALATMRLVARHKFLQRQEKQNPDWPELPSEAETRLLLQQQAVLDLANAFPEATLVSVGPVTYPPPPTDPAGHDQPLDHEPEETDAA